MSIKNFFILFVCFAVGCGLPLKAVNPKHRKEHVVSFVSKKLEDGKASVSASLDEPLRIVPFGSDAGDLVDRASLLNDAALRTEPSAFACLPPEIMHRILCETSVNWHSGRIVSESLQHPFNAKALRQSEFSLLKDALELRLVCRQFNDLMVEHGLTGLATASIRTPEQLSEIASSGRSFNVCIEGEEALKALAFCAKVCELHLDFCKINDLSMLLAHTSLQNLVLFGCMNLSDLHGLENCSALTALNLRRCRSLLSFRGIENCVQLRHLSFRQNMLQPGSVPEIDFSDILERSDDSCPEQVDAQALCVANQKAIWTLQKFLKSKR